MFKTQLTFIIDDIVIFIITKQSFLIARFPTTSTMSFPMMMAVVSVAVSSGISTSTSRMTIVRVRWVSMRGVQFFVVFVECVFALTCRATWWASLGENDYFKMNYFYSMTSLLLCMASLKMSFKCGMFCVLKDLIFCHHRFITPHLHPYSHLLRWSSVHSEHLPTQLNPQCSLEAACDSSSINVLKPRGK